MALGEKYFGYSQRRTSRDQTYESLPPKKKITNFKLWAPLAFIVLFISLSSCSSKKIITERQMPKVKKEVLISTGCHTEKEIKAVIGFINNLGSNWTMFHCISNYPVINFNANFSYIHN